MNSLLLTDDIFVHKMNEKLEEWKKARESGVLRYKSCLGLDEI